MDNAQDTGDAGRAAPSQPRWRACSSRLEAIAKVLNVEPSFFRAPKSAIAELDMAVVTGLLATAEGRRLASAYLRIQEPDRRESILALVAFMSAGPSSTA